MHLATLAQPMADPRVGVVTCLYRSIANGVAGALDALGLSTDFQPSVLVARKIEGITFGLGSGTLVRRLALEKAGGFEAIADMLADDYMLGHLPVQAGYRAVLSPDIVDHELSTSSLRGIADHQLRWNRGIRSVRPAGYLGLAFTQGLPASLLLLVLTAGSPASWTAFGLTFGVRLAMAWFVAVRCLRDRAAARSLWLVPLRDLLNFAFWIAAFFGSVVVWRGTRYRLQPGGRLARDGAVRDESEPALVGTQAAP
jgi:ceramide glucosyltransferase